MKLPALFLSTIAAVLFITPVHAQGVGQATAITFSDHGKVVHTSTLEELKTFAPPAPVRVWVLHEEAEVEFQGLPLISLLDRVYGGAWRKAQEILFICADGYRNPVSVTRIKEHASWLAFARTGSSAFEMTEKEPVVRKVDLQPYFLVWDTLKDPAMRAAGKEGWPYQVVGLDLIEFADRFPSLTPSAKASASAKRGFASFKQYCVSCHSLSGAGGKVGPELNSPVSVTTYYKENWLKRWIANPSSVRANTLMPEVLPAGRTREGVVNDLVAYLKAMAPLQK